MVAAVEAVKSFARTRSGSQAIRALAILWAVLAVGSGVILPLFSYPHLHSATFGVAFGLIHPAFWGLTYFVLGVASLMALAIDKTIAGVLLSLVGFVTFILAFLTVGTFSGQGGAPFITWLMIVVAVAILVTAGPVDEVEDDYAAPNLPGY